MRCSNCNKFVSFNTEEDPEETQEPKIDETTFKAEYRRYLTCQDCSSELKEASLEVEQDLEDSIDAECEKHPQGEHDWKFDLEVQPTERTEGKGRSAKMFYGISVDGKVTCERCGQEATISCSEEEQASAMDELE